MTHVPQIINKVNLTQKLRQIFFVEGGGGGGCYVSSNSCDWLPDYIYQVLVLSGKDLFTEIVALLVWINLAYLYLQSSVATSSAEKFFNAHIPRL